MFALIINISISSGAATFSSQLSEVRSKLSEVSKTIRDLESNFILLLVHPEIVVLNNAKKSGENNEEESTINQATIVKTINTNPSDILSDISIAWSLKKVLFSKEYHLTQKVIELFKNGDLSDLPTKTT